MRSGKDGSMVVRKHNELIEAKYKLTLNEQRLILNLITILTPDDDDFMDYTIQASDVALMFGVQDRDFYIKLQDAVKTLMNRTIDISKGNVVELVHWFSNIRYVRGSGKINVRFDKAIKPYLLQLKDHFTQYQIGAIAQFKSSYSVRFYELLKMKEFQGNGGQFYRIFPIEELRAYMQLEPTEYSVFQDLKKRVIVPALKEIDQHSDLSIVQVNYIKKGRSIDSIKITVDPKKQILMDMYEVKEPEKNDAIQELILFGIGEETAIKWAKKYGQERVMRNISYTLVMQQEGKVNSPQLYLSKAIQ
ncbi:MAG: replication initiation protein, partial [Pseudomonadales bacterium]|nr:replication initiation protein [Pseudomonadales bacterium]